MDASVWIRIGRNHPPDRFPTLWKLLEEDVKAGRLRSPQEVLHELEQGEDDLAERLRIWKDLFVPLSEELQAEVVRVNSRCPTLVDPESDRNKADPFVVALAKLMECVAVTNERQRASTTAPMKIPHACAVLGLRYLDWFGFLRDRNWRF